MKRSEIRANRQKWIDFLLVKGRKRAEGLLDIGGGNRCCLGHACYVMGLKPYKIAADDIFWNYDGQEASAPESLVESLGLWGSQGENPHGTNYVEGIDYTEAASLVTLNDDMHWTPKEIGIYLQSVIEGGPDTPFRALTSYKE